MKKNVVLIGIYALSITYLIIYVISSIAFHTGSFNDFFVKHYTLFYLGRPVSSIIFYVLFGMLAVCLSKEPKRTKQEMLTDLLLIDLPAVIGVTYYFWWGGLYNLLLESPLDGSWLHLFLVDEIFRELALIIGGLMLGVEIMRYIGCFKHKPESV